MPEDGGLRLDVVLDLKEGEEDDGGVGGEEDEDVPGTMEVGEAHGRPPGTEHPGGGGGGRKGKVELISLTTFHDKGGINKSDLIDIMKSCDNLDTLCRFNMLNRFR